MQFLREDEIEELKIKLPKKVGNKIIQFRRQKKYTQTDLAIKTNKDRQYIYKIEKGIVTPNIVTLAIIAKALEIKLFQLFEDL